MARQQGPFDWQGRLESDGEVTFGSSMPLTGGRLTVTHEGLQVGRGPVVDVARLRSVAIARQTLTISYDALPDEQLRGRDRSTGQRLMRVSLPRFGPFHPDDLAVWLLKLKGGPAADVVEQKQPLGRVFQLRSDRPD
jgi:hypothetical protein